MQHSLKYFKCIGSMKRKKRFSQNGWNIKCIYSYHTAYLLHVSSGGEFSRMADRRWDEIWDGGKYYVHKKESPLLRALPHGYIIFPWKSELIFLCIIPQAREFKKGWIICKGNGFNFLLLLKYHFGSSSRIWGEYHNIPKEVKFLEGYKNNQSFA